MYIIIAGACKGLIREGKVEGKEENRAHDK